jgi:hypothetical protein
MGVYISNERRKQMTAKRVTMSALASIGLTAVAAVPSLTSFELEHARLYLQQTQDEVVGATKGLSPAQWNFKPAPDRWSIAEILEHMVLTQDLVLGPVREKLAKAPPTSADRDYKQVDAFVLSQIPDRTTKFKAPDLVQPTGRWTPEVARDRLIRNYAQLTAYLETTPDLRQHAVEAPPLKAVSKGAYETMDGYQWILAAAAHVERHTKQILEVKADANFPLK